MEPREENVTRHCTHDNIRFLHDLRQGHTSVQVTDELKLGAARIMKAYNQIVMTREARMGAPYCTSPDLSRECCTVLQEFFPFLMRAVVPDSSGGGRR